MQVEEFEINDSNITAYIYPDKEIIIHLNDFEAFLKENDRLYCEWFFNAAKSYKTLTIFEYLENTERYVIMDDLSDYMDEYEAKIKIKK